MHAEARAFVAAWAGVLKPARVLEVGSRNINGGVRDLFAKAVYVGIDTRDGPGVDVIADGATYRAIEPFDAVLCLEVLEHAPDAAGLCQSLVANCRPGGVILVTAAGPKRRPHNATDGGPDLAPGEHYANVSAKDLRHWLAAGCATVLTETAGADVRAVAVRGAA